jgi:hypothetical protein
MAEGGMRQKNRQQGRTAELVVRGNTTELWYYEYNREATRKNSDEVQKRMELVDGGVGSSSFLRPRPAPKNLARCAGKKRRSVGKVKGVSSIYL